jgi:hypothetical protein
MSYEEILEIGEIVYVGYDDTFNDFGLMSDLDYYYALFNVNGDNYSLPFKIEKKVRNDYSELKNLANVSSDIVEEVSYLEALRIKQYNQKVPLDDNSIRLYNIIVSQNKGDLSDSERYSIAYFIYYGGQVTKWLGAGERAGVLNSYFSVFGKLPRTVEEWQDVVKIANGRWPKERNLEAELKSKTESFQTIYKRDPDINNSNDNAAVTVITYGLRPADRNMDSEKAGIKIFESIYKHSPESASDWDIVRAIAYSGAKR